MRFHGFIVKVPVMLAAAFLFASFVAEGVAEGVAANEYPGAKGITSHCTPRILHAPTRYPEKAQSRGAGGAVKMQVLLDSERVLESRLLRSSGDVLLDNAAVESARLDWEFDVRHCDTSTLPLSTVVTVQYSPVPKYVSFSNERRSAARALATSNDRCTVTPTNRKEQLIACVR